MLKRKKGGDVDDKIAREIVRLMPKLPQTVDRIFDKVEQFDFRQPTTFIAEMKADMRSCAPQLGGRERRILSRLWKLLRLLPLERVVRWRMNEVIRITKSEAAKDARYSLLLKLMSEADAKVPLVSIIVSLRHADPEATLGPLCAPYDMLEQAERERGEARATAVLRALADTAEALYKPYLITLWALSYLKEGEVPPEQVPSFGNLVKDTHRRLANYPGLVEPDAGWMRNSAVHNPRKYLLVTDALEMWDKNVAHKAVPVDELYAMVKRMYLISGMTVQRVGQLYMFRNVFAESGLLDAFVEFLPHLFTLDEQKVLTAEARFFDRAHDVIRPLEEFFNAHARPART
ncbi:MAG: hypothetical protein LC803_20180 [Acidobacteria bacterium]|nr:hypothetical protein [Acidobacteriota bacterium]